MSSEKASDAIENVMGTPYNMEERVGDLEARRLLAHLEYSRIPDSVCEENVSRLCSIAYRDTWARCNKLPLDVFNFVNNQNKKWAKAGYRIVIEGGNERQRLRVMNFCMYRAILARFASWTYIARIYDWPTILPVIGDWKHADKHSIIDGMQKIKVLGLTEIDLKLPRTMGNLETILTSVLRGRMLSGKPTIMTLKSPSWLCDTVSPCEIHDLVHTDHDEDEMMVLRIRIDGDK